LAGPIGLSAGTALGANTIDGRGLGESIGMGAGGLVGGVAGPAASFVGSRAGANLGRGIDAVGWDATLDYNLDSIASDLDNLGAPPSPGNDFTSVDFGGDLGAFPDTPASPVASPVPEPRDATALYDLIFSPYAGDYRTYGQGPAHQYWQKVPRTNGVSNA
jgi:hypothetical protein